MDTFHKTKCKQFGRNTLCTKEESKFTARLDNIAVTIDLFDFGRFGCFVFATILPFVLLPEIKIKPNAISTILLNCISIRFQIKCARCFTSTSSPILNFFRICFASLEWPKSSNSFVQSRPALSEINSPPPGC